MELAGPVLQRPVGGSLWAGPQEYRPVEVWDRRRGAGRGSGPANAKK